MTSEKTLEQPEHYMPALNRLRARDKYAINWPLRVERHTNRHPETLGGSWGWYEVHPLGIEVGYWNNRTDDLKGTDLTEWNDRAKDLSSANAYSSDSGQNNCKS